MRNESAASGLTPAAWTGVYAVAILLLVNAIGYLDRQILVMVVAPIKTELALSDASVGLVHGAAFMITYAIAGVFLGDLIDRRNRRNLLVVCVLLWSAFTAAGGFARSGVELFIARMGVGIGEAALVPVAVSLLSDYFSPQQRGKALGLFMVGGYVGVGLSLVLAGIVLPPLEALSQTLAARGMPVSPWRMLLMSMWIPGLLAATLLLTVREPARRFSMAAAPSPGFRYWLLRWRRYLPHHTGFALFAFCSFGLHAWAPTALIREYGLSVSQVGPAYGAIVIASGVAGAFVGGWAGDVAARGRGRMYAAFPLGGLAAVGMIGALLAPTAPLVMAAFGVVNLGLSAALVVGLSSVTDIAEAEVRGRTSALYLLFAGVIGMAGAPALIGAISDRLAGTDLRLIITVCSIVALSMGAALLMTALRAHRPA